jgi:general secretion pathway protein C
MNTVSWLAGPDLPASSTPLLTHAPRLAIWVLAAALGVQAAIIVTHLAGRGASHALRAPAPMASAARPPFDLTLLTDAHLFGAAPVPPPVNEADAPPTNMPLLLTGIFAAKDPKGGLAIIGTSASNAKVYPVGDRVPGNARVHAIYIDRVLLERNGAIEALMLRKFGGGGGGGPVQATSPGPAALDAVPEALPRQAVLVTDVIRPQTVFAQGKMRGYRLHPGPNAEAFATLGLRNGDLVVAINGTPLNDPSRSNDIFSNLGDTDQAHVTVMRNGQQQDITLNMSQIANQPEQLSDDSSDQTAPAPRALRHSH